MSQSRKLALLAGAALSLNAFGVASAQTADQDRAYQAEMLADASSRTSLLQHGGGGHDGQFHIGDGTGNYRLNIGGYTQFRYVLNFRDDDSAATEDEDFANGFDLARANLIFSGNIINPETTFYIRGDFGGGETGEEDGSFDLLEAWGNYQFDNGIGLKWGQYKVPVLREWLVSDIYQLAADRSVMHSVFGPGYTQGIAVHYRDESWGFVLSANDGPGTGNTSFFNQTESDVGLTGRLEVKWAGDWEQFDDFTSFRGSTENYAGMLGAGVHWSHYGDTAAFAGGAPVSVAEMDLILYSVDLSVEGDGWNLFAAFVGQHNDPDGSDSSDDFGFLVQGGWFMTEQFELFGRWDAVFPDEDAYGPGFDEDFHTLTFGANYYFVEGSHAAKFTADIQIFLNEVGQNTPVARTAPNAYTTLLPDTEDGQVALRFQMQLVF